MATVPWAGVATLDDAERVAVGIEVVARREHVHRCPGVCAGHIVASDGGEAADAVEVFGNVTAMIGGTSQATSAIAQPQTAAPTLVARSRSVVKSRAYPFRRPRIA